MGSNDQNPTGSATLKPWKHGPVKEVMFWADIDPKLVFAIVAAASRAGAFVGFGSAQEQTALLLYIKNGRINERVALENYSETKSFVDFVLNNWLDAPH